MSKWVPLLLRIQAHGRLVVALCEPWEVEVLINELVPEGLLLQTSCDSEEEAQDLLKQAPNWMRRNETCYIINGNKLCTIQLHACFCIPKIEEWLSTSDLKI